VLIKKREGKITELNKIMVSTHPSTSKYNYFTALIFQLKECIKNLKDASLPRTYTSKKSKTIQT